MKTLRKLPAALLALAMLMSVTLAGCQSRVTPPDEVAVALFDLMFHNDVTAVQTVFGYDSEDAIWADFDTSDIIDAVADQVIAQLEDLFGATAAKEDVQYLLNALLTAVSTVEFSAQVKEMDKRNGTAVVTCNVGTLDATTFDAAFENALTDIPSDVSDFDALLSTIICAMADAYRSMEPSGETASFDVDFSLEITRSDGRPAKVWLPSDSETFGRALFAAIVGD